MAILEKEVLIRINNNTAKHYKNKGYDVKGGSEILVKFEDLTKGSNVRVTKICDICGHLVPNQKYSTVLRYRNNNNDKNDKCNDCSAKEKGEKKSFAVESDCIATTHPEFAKLFWNEADTFRYSYGSNRKVDFKCQDCGRCIENKTICDIYRDGVYCVKCSDGISYPEKIMFNILKQLGVEFEFQVKFDWSNNKKYDFYIPQLRCIIETHGKQHYEESPRGRSLEDEQENDRLKEQFANKNKINNYIVIDCRKSELEWIKHSILGSKLNKLFELSTINWNNCHGFACKTLIKKACDLWMLGIRNTVEIGNILKIHRTTITTYLKKGSKLGWCDYDPKEAMRESGLNRGKSNSKKIVQLTTGGEFVGEWNSITEASKKFNVSVSFIVKACKTKCVARGFKWMYKEDYDKII